MRGAVGMGGKAGDKSPDEIGTAAGAGDERGLQGSVGVADSALEVVVTQGGVGLDDLENCAGAAAGGVQQGEALVEGSGGEGRAAQVEPAASGVDLEVGRYVGASFCLTKHAVMSA
ncbi:hypothetical protein GCM10010353_63940 [Streptomyces chryseus]|nr:hypothetical protein GCM10010353_63940 [Streptomyces chryseus]